MPLTAYSYMHAWEQWANTGKMSHTQAPAHLNWQTVGTKLKAKQTAQALITQGQVMVKLRHRPPMRANYRWYAHKFASLEGADQGETCSPSQTS